MIEYYKNKSLKNLFYIDENGIVQEEEWRDIPDCNKSYQISNLARIKSVERIIKREPSFFKQKTMILKQHIGKRGYLVCGINQKERTVHQLVAIAFLSHVPCGYKVVVDHIDNNKLNCIVSNLQLITHRENCSKDKVGTSKYTGVSWNKERDCWQSSIRICGKKIVLYNGESEEYAKEIYLKAKNNEYLFDGSIKNFQELVGVVHSKFKLTENKVLAIRRLHKINPNFNKKLVQEKLGIKYMTLYDVLTYKNWKNVKL